MFPAVLLPLAVWWVFAVCVGVCGVPRGGVSVFLLPSLVSGACYFVGAWFFSRGLLRRLLARGFPPSAPPLPASLRLPLFLEKKPCLPPLVSSPFCPVWPFCGFGGCVVRFAGAPVVGGGRCVGAAPSLSCRGGVVFCRGLVFFAWFAPSVACPRFRSPFLACFGVVAVFLAPVSVSSPFAVGFAVFVALLVSLVFPFPPRPCPWLFGGGPAPPRRCARVFVPRSVLPRRRGRLGAGGFLAVPAVVVAPRSSSVVVGVVVVLLASCLPAGWSWWLPWSWLRLVVAAVVVVGCGVPSVCVCVCVCRRRSPRRRRRRRRRCGHGGGCGGLDSGACPLAVGVRVFAGKGIDNSRFLCVAACQFAWFLCRNTKKSSLFAPLLHAGGAVCSFGVFGETRSCCFAIV